LNRLGHSVHPLPLGARYAVLFVLLSGFLNSFGGLILRNIQDASEWQIVVFRTGSLSLALLIMMLMRKPGDFLASIARIGSWGLVAALLFATMQTLFVFSLSNTTVANTVFILSSGPIITAVLARLVLGERVDMATWGILLLALIGVTLMVGDGLSSDSWLGNLAAVGGAVSFAGFVVIFRAKRQVDMMPSVVIGGFIAMAVAAIMTGGQLSIPLPDLALSVFWGGIISSAVLAFFTVASRHLSGAELTLLLMLEYFLGPFWVWLFINEVPSMMTLVGGAIVLSGVLAQAYLSSARPKMA